MLFINTRPLDENATSSGERRPSKAHSHGSHHSHPSPASIQMTRLVLCLVLFYLLVSIFPVLFYFPIALTSLLVPVILLLYALCRVRDENRSDQWPCVMVATSGILLKIAAIIIYIVVFPTANESKLLGVPVPRKQNRADANAPHYRAAFFLLLVSIEIFVLLIGACLKWHLVAFQKMETDAKMRRLTMTSSRPLLSEAASRRISRDQS